MSSRRLSNGRSPLVNKQRQITSFFTSGSKKSSTSNPNRLNPIRSPRPRSLKEIEVGVDEEKEEKYGDVVVGRRVRVFWPLDKTWYEGVVRSEAAAEGKHLVEYDDGEEEVLDLAKERIEWVEGVEEETPRSFRRSRKRIVEEEEEGPKSPRRLRKRNEEDKPKSLRRLRRKISISEAEEEEDVDWVKYVGEELEDEEDKEVELEEEDEGEGLGRLKRGENEGKKVDSIKKMKVNGSGAGRDKVKACPLASPSNGSSKPAPLVDGKCFDSGLRKRIVEDEVTKSSRRLRKRNEEDMPKSSRRRISILESEEEEDEDWMKNVGEELEDEEDEEVELEEEDEEEGLGRPRKTVGSRKRGDNEVKKVDSVKMMEVNRSGGGYEKFKACQLASPPNGSSKPTHLVDKSAIPNGNDAGLVGDAAERFGKREAEKFWFLLDGRKDANGRRPSDVNYDPKTLFLPQGFLKSLSGCQRQWWEFKCKNMDKVLFFKMGKFYEFFEMDAHIAVRELDLQYMKGEQPHCGFPEKNFSMNLEKLARKGFRVLVIEQTETPEQLERRRKEMGSKDKVVKREICAVVTKGTLTEGELLSANPDASYLLSLTEKCRKLDNCEENTVIGVCVVDVSTSKFMLGQFEDDVERNCLCSLLSELRPVEIIKPLKVLSPETEKVLQMCTRNPLLNDLVPLMEFWDAEKTVAEITNMYQHAGEDSMHLPDVLCELIDAGESGNFALSAFGGCIFYLRQAFLDETLLRCAKFELLPHSDFRSALQKEYMVLDAAALESLEILENNRNGTQSGTLFARLNHCVTAFGKRLLRSWLARPLYDSELIVERQDAIAGLKVPALASALEFRKDISRLPDMERLLARLFANYECNARNANKIILYEDAAKKQLKEFIAALRGCELMTQACSTFSALLKNSSSSLLHHLLTPGKGFPDLISELKHFKDAFDWSEADQSGRIIPHAGCDPEYDSVCTSIKKIEFNLKKYLEEQRKALRDTSINYVTVGKDSYLLELPEHLRSKIPQDYELQSSKKGFFRYWTPKIKKWLSECTQAEAEKESKLKSILHRLIERFSKHHKKWRLLVSTVAELDVVISLAIASDYYEGPTCRPTIKAASFSDEVTPPLAAKCLGHPLLHTDVLGKGSFVPNDVSIGGVGNPSFILLTGPNMGGKSTLIRQVCLAVILAQIGADVPAESFELSPVDRIFVRMGAKDHIMAGQSTFLTELSETATMLSSSTQNSLVALDELGRGTSTSDGQAIAESVLEYFIHNIRCRGMFSTHYHRLAVDYEKSSMVSLCHMACQVGKGVEGIEEVTFLYKLTAGSCPKSYGVNVARLAGLPVSVLQTAMDKSREFEAVYGKQRCNSEINLWNTINDDGSPLIKDILQTAFAIDCDEKIQFSSLKELTELHQRAKSKIQRL